jgi:hypothetical protein
MAATKKETEEQRKLTTKGTKVTKGVFSPGRRGRMKEGAIVNQRI